MKFDKLGSSNEAMMHTLANFKLLIIFGVGVALMTIGFRQLLRASTSRSWPVVTGTIVEARVAVLNKKRSTEYEVQIRYRYTVEGKTYAGQRISFADGFNSNDRSEAEATLHRLTANGAVQVHYNPTNPDDALLAPDETEGSWALVAFGVFALGLALVLGRKEIKALLRGTSLPRVRKWPAAPAGN